MYESLGYEVRLPDHPNRRQHAVPPARQDGCIGAGDRLRRLGIGGAGSGWVGAQEDESVRALHRAIELGINFVDTARGYSASERVVGGVLREHRGDQIYVATKVPPKNRQWPAPSGLDPMDTFPGEHIRASVETSLRESGLQAFDVLQLHVWSDEWVGRGDWLETVDELKRDGMIRFFGVSINDYQPENAIELIRTGVVDTVQVIYNVFHQAPHEQLFPACLEYDVGVIVRVALDEGGLTGRIRADTTFPDEDFRSTFFGGDRAAHVEAHVDALCADLGIDTDDVADMALRFALDQPAVSTVIAGMRARCATSSETPRPATDEHSPTSSGPSLLATAGSATSTEAARRFDENARNSGRFRRIARAGARPGR